MRGYLETIRENIPRERDDTSVHRQGDGERRPSELVITDILKLHAMESAAEFPTEQIDITSIIDSVVTLIGRKRRKKCVVSA
jgi:hypothetical protein